MARAVVLFLVPLLVWACGLPPAVGPGYVQGTVLGWPSAPQGNGTIPARDAKVRFLDASRREIAVTTTDSHGNFRVSIPAGRYEIDVLAFGQDPIIESANGKPTQATPVFVTVMAGMTTTLDLVVFTGIL